MSVHAQFGYIINRMQYVYLSKEKYDHINKICARLKWLHRTNNPLGKYIIEEVRLVNDTKVCDYYRLNFTVGTDSANIYLDPVFQTHLYVYLEQFIVNYIYPKGGIEFRVSYMSYEKA